MSSQLAHAQCGGTGIYYDRECWGCKGKGYVIDDSPWTDEQARAFMDEIAAVCKKYQVTVSACSCCDGVNVDVGRICAIHSVQIGDDGDWDATTTTGSTNHVRSRLEAQETS